MTVRSTCHGEAPSAAAACPGRGSSDSHATPTVRTTTATLKKTSPQTMATGRAVEAEEAERPALPQQLAEGDADDDRRQHERHQQRRAHRRAAGQREPVEGVRRRQAERRRRAASRRPEVHTVNQATRCTRGRARTSSTAPGAKRPSTTNPSATMPATGRTKRTPSTRTGPAARASRPATRRAAAGGRVAGRGTSPGVPRLTGR